MQNNEVALNPRRYLKTTLLADFFPDLIPLAALVNEYNLPIKERTVKLHSVSQSGPNSCSLTGSVITAARCIF